MFIFARSPHICSITSHLLDHLLHSGNTRQVLMEKFREFLVEFTFALSNLVVFVLGKHKQVVRKNRKQKLDIHSQN